MDSPLLCDGLALPLLGKRNPISRDGHPAPLRWTDFACDRLKTLGTF
ncbi:hypothetical protein KP509_22G032400 [Ceratopteris richardii]|uniref:Uncharacterized protein n=1 Tax=Ceratopteris richardii TaxID=49495 RepID=A0A8T2S6J3_CERRI|nr:hypothetical protein KP509_22G032400 [Ceratopteris richardii]